MADTGSAVPQAKARESKIAYVENRRGRYLAQAMEDFEANLEPLLPKKVAEDFKKTLRRKFGAVAADVISLIELQDQAKNGFAQEVMDRLFKDGPPRRD